MHGLSPPAVLFHFHLFEVRSHGDRFKSNVASIASKGNDLGFWEISIAFPACENGKFYFSTKLVRSDSCESLHLPLTFLVFSLRGKISLLPSRIEVLVSYSVVMSPLKTFSSRPEVLLS